MSEVLLGHFIADPLTINNLALGKREVHLINHMVNGVSKLIEFEKALENGEDVDCAAIAMDLSTDG